VPARGYSWPPFAPGHELSLKHGAASPRMVRPIADQLAAELAEVAPWAAAPQFAAARAGWARVEAQLVLLHRYLDEHGLLDDAGEPRPAATWAAKLEGRAQSLRAELGLSPASMAKLLGDLSRTSASGDGVDALKAAGRALLEGRPS
jgi:hypothetical protein